MSRLFFSRKFVRMEAQDGGQVGRIGDIWRLHTNFDTRMRKWSRAAGQPNVDRSFERPQHLVLSGDKHKKINFSLDPFDYLVNEICFLKCYTHNSLGWKINVVDRGFEPPKARGAASSLVGFRISSLAVLLLPLSVLFLWPHILNSPIRAVVFSVFVSSIFTRKLTFGI